MPKGVKVSAVRGQKRAKRDFSFKHRSEREGGRITKDWFFCRKGKKKILGGEREESQKNTLKKWEKKGKSRSSCNGRGLGYGKGGRTKPSTTASGKKNYPSATISDRGFPLLKGLIRRGQKSTVGL